MFTPQVAAVSQPDSNWTARVCFGSGGWKARGEFGGFNQSFGWLKIAVLSIQQQIPEDSRKEASFHPHAEWHLFLIPNLLSK